MSTHWDGRYDRDDYFFGTAPNDFLVETAGQVNKGKTLCLADGEGRNGVFLAEQGFDVTSIDASRVGLGKARQLAAERGVQVSFEQADLFTHDLGDSKWDLAVSIFFHMPSDRRAEVHRRVARAIKPGGYLILEAYTPKQLEYGTGGPPTADMLQTADILRDDFATLDIVSLIERDRQVVEGPGHTGDAAVVQLLARRPR